VAEPFSAITEAAARGETAELFVDTRATSAPSANIGKMVTICRAIRVARGGL